MPALSAPTGCNSSADNPTITSVEAAKPPKDASFERQTVFRSSGIVQHRGVPGLE